MKRSAAVAFALACALVADSVQAKPIAPEDLAQFKVGATTEADVVKVLGRPQSVSVVSTGSTTIAYVSIKTRLKAATFIPYVGLFAGGATSNTSVTTLTFGADGRLTSYQSTASEADCSSNILGPGCKGGVPVAPPPTSSPAAPLQPTSNAAPATNSP
jgi:outer membrane protein assembly factor BamE (lipoprotein component of BamABCDE complex)